MADNVKIYRSRINLLFWLILLLCLFGMFYLQIRESLNNPTVTSIIILITIWTPLFTFIFTIIFGTRYILGSDKLTIKIGPVTHSEILIRDIYSVARTFNLIASPANAFRRLRLNYEDGFVIISPVHESAFLLDLKKLNPRIIYREFEL